MSVTDWQDEYFIMELEKWLMKQWEEEENINIHPPQKKKNHFRNEVFFISKFNYQ